MKLVVDSFWRALAYCMHPRVIALSLLPLLIMGALTFGLGYLFWEDAVETVRHTLYAWDWLNAIWSGLDRVGLGPLKTVVPALVVIVAVTPLLVVLSLLAVAVAMTPAMVQMVQQRRFAHLERRHGASLLASVGWSIGSTLLALVALVVSLPLWLVPPLLLIVPPLIWGWLTYRVFTFDVLASHASPEERAAIFKRHKMTLLGMGIVCGYLGAAPGIVWVSGALFAALFVLLVPVAMWIYTLVFAFSSLWFAHYGLAALQQLRAQTAAAPSAQPSNAEPLTLDAPTRVLTPGDAPALPDQS